MPFSNLAEVYDTLLKTYGVQGWWPLSGHQGTNPTKTGAHSGYHQGDYSYPHNESEQFEIAVGAILTQNTAWTNVEMALERLAVAGVLHSPEKLLGLPLEDLKEAIKPAGYFNQKAEYLRTMAMFFCTKPRNPKRTDLLSLRGVGEETADAILLYAFSQPTFVIDAYTKRFLIFHGFCQGNEKYGDIQKLFHNSLPLEVPLFQEYHALLVEHCKQYFSKKPFGDHF